MLKHLQNVLSETRNTKRIRLNLPFQVIGSHSRTATVILATTLAVLAKRPEEDESAQLETLVLDHVSDTSIIEICQNPMDLVNAINVFVGLKNLVMSIKRQESAITRQSTFTQNLWFLIRKAVRLDSLCLIGWNVKRNMKTRKYSHGVSFSNWNMRSLPFLEDNSRRLRHLRFLELKRVDIDPFSLINIIKQSSQSLKEVFLNEVYLKVHGGDGAAKTNLWIGLPDVSKPPNCCWIAEELRGMEGLNLDIIKATGLGYDDFEPLVESALPDYDLKDPTGQERSFDRRFVETALGISDETESKHTASVTKQPEEVAVGDSPPKPWIQEHGNIGRSVEEYDSETFQRHHNTTSHFKRCIDGYFYNKNEGALRELQKVITVADRGMNLLSDEIFRPREGDVIPAGDAQSP